MSKRKTLELLAPAKNLQAGVAAVNTGADALYTGAPRFGARAAASNSISDIEQLAAYAHRFNSKVYVTLNTLLYDDELEEARRLAVQMFEAGADALIIQDMAFLEMDLPPIALFASTQTNNYLPEKVKFLQDAGFKRIILARELSLKQIREIRRDTEIDLESFIHGALCVSYSGQCYMSHYSTDRSANRGCCSQPCRLKYTIEDAKGRVLIKDKYLLSLKDLNLSARIAELIDAGISSFKIEGRLKNANYVKNITAYYRRILDEIISSRGDYCAASDGKVYSSFEPDPERTFNRGYTEYFISGTPEKLSSFDTPKSAGSCAGTVSMVGDRYFEFEKEVQLRNGDGICWFTPGGELNGMNINRAEGRRVYVRDTKGLRPGTKVFRNRENEISSELDDRNIRRLIQVHLELSETPAGVMLSATDGNGNSASAEAVLEKQPADNPERMKETITRQLNKSGEAVFSAESISLDMPHVLFIPVSVLNGLRRDAYSALEKARLVPGTSVGIQKTDHAYIKETLDFRDNVLNRLAAQFYTRHGVREINPGFEIICKDGIIASENPVVLMTCKYCIRRELDMCRKESRTEAAGNLYLRNAGHRYLLRFNCSKCEMEVCTD